ncbi:MAG: sulfatase-like hydrolase/transferase [Planctomycetota bacterium]
MQLPWSIGLIVLFAILRTTSLGAFPIPQAEHSRPNILLILTDDQAVDTLAAWGTWGNDAQVVKTPHLDRLVARGTSFTRAYNMGSYSPAVCVCSRGMLISGQSLWKTERLQKDRFRGLQSAGKLWPQRMKAAGYETWMSGKWHVDAPVEELFDHVSHVRPGMPASVDSAYNRPPLGKPDEWSPWETALGGYWQGGKHWSEVLADDAEDFLREAAGGDLPFFMYLAFNAPHDPRQTPRDYVEAYPQERVPVPANFLPINQDHEAMGLGPASREGLRDEVLAPFPRTEDAVRLHRREYYALVTHLDAQIGRILEALESSGMAERTVVIFTSDHGLAVGRHGLMGKQNMYEHSLRVPFVIAGPGIPRGKSDPTPIYLQDAMATALELAGADASEIDFRSLLPLIHGERSEQYSRIYAMYMRDRQRAVIEGKWKLIEYPVNEKVQLFNLEEDPQEQRDLAGAVESREILERLGNAANDWAKKDLD